MPQMRQTGTSSGGVQKSGQQQGRSDMGTKKRQQKAMETTCESQGNGGRKRRRIGKRRKSSVSNGVRDRTKPKPIEMRNLYAALNNTEALNNERNHIMVTIRLQGTIGQITINAMIDSGATEDFIDKGFCSNYNIQTTQAKTIREVYLADGRPSAMGPITHIAKVPMDIGSHRELAIFQVAKLPNHEVILGNAMVKATQSPNRLGPRKDHIRKRTMYDMVFKGITNGIRNTRRRGARRELESRVRRDPKQERSENPS